jgi:hypothetical protein
VHAAIRIHHFGSEIGRQRLIIQEQLRVRGCDAELDHGARRCGGLRRRDGRGNSRRLRAFAQHEVTNAERRAKSDHRD